MLHFRATMLLIFFAEACTGSKPPLHKMFKLALSRYIDNIEEYLEAEIHCRDEVLYPNNSFVLDVLRIMRLNNITVKNNNKKQGKIIPKRRNYDKGDKKITNNNKKQGKTIPYRRNLNKGENMIKNNYKKHGKIIPKRRNFDDKETMDHEHDRIKLTVESNQNHNSNVGVHLAVNVPPDSKSRRKETDQADLESRVKLPLPGDPETQLDVQDTAEQGYIYDDRTGSCYYFHMENFTWYEASKNCELEGGHLAVINDETEANVIMELFAQYPPEALLHLYWWDHVNIGFYDIIRKDYTQADFRTVINPDQTVQEAGYDRFAPYQPKQPWCPEYDYYCGAAGRDGVLSTVCCVWTMASICEREPENTEHGIRC